MRVWRRPKAAGGLAAAGAVLLVAAFLLQDALYATSLRPVAGFAREATPPPPDYASPAAWAAWPDPAPPGAWETPWGVDVFFVHPTTGYGGRWTIAAEDARAGRRLSEHALPTWGEPFRAAGPLYAPRYRQASLHAERAGDAGAGALDLAYSAALTEIDTLMNVGSVRCV